MIDLKYKLYIVGLFVTGPFMTGCRNGVDNNTHIGVNPNKPTYNIENVVLNHDATKNFDSIKSDSIFNNIREKVFYLKNYKKDYVNDANDNFDWVGYVDAEKELREEYSQLSLNCAITWKNLEKYSNSSAAFRQKKLNEYDSMVEDANSSFKLIRNVTIDPNIQILANYERFSIMHYDKDSKHLFEYQILLGEGGESEKSNGSGYTKSDRRIRIQKIDLGKDFDALKNYQNNKGKIVGQKNMSLDFADRDFTYGYIIDNIDN
ncbi:MAG: hypothetical protein ACP5NV_00880 [Candidatus Woesearchaeota archaeon]